MRGHDLRGLSGTLTIAVSMSLTRWALPQQYLLVGVRPGVLVVAAAILCRPLAGVLMT